MPVRAYLYDATQNDSEVELNAQVLSDLHDRQMLWIDVTSFSEAEIREVASLLALDAASLPQLLKPERRPRLDNYGRYFQLNVMAVEENKGRYDLRDICFILADNIVLSVHQQPVNFLDSFDRRVKGDSELGELDAPAFLAALLDWHITSFFRRIEELEAEVDRIDVLALRPHHERDLLSDLLNLRRRVGIVRRALTPHREVYAGMARPDFHGQSDAPSTAHYTLLSSRLERAIEAVENARELLVGSFDIFTTQTAMRTNEAMKVLTLVSFIWFPASVIVGIAALLLKTPVYSIGRDGFWVMLAVIGMIGAATLAFARFRRWI